MIDFFFILILIIILGIIGGTIYLIYLPFKIRLRKNGKLTDKLNRQINRTYILFLIIIGSGIIIFLNIDNWKTDIERIEKTSDIKIPSDYKIIKDEYQDMWQDYCIICDLQFDNKSLKELTDNIKSSKFYNPVAFHKGAWRENDMIKIDSVKAVWAQSPKGYDFITNRGLTSYRIELDTLTKTLKYTECAD